MLYNTGARVSEITGLRVADVLLDRAAAVLRYIEADFAMKEAALRRVEAPTTSPVRFKARDGLLAFLEGL